MGNLLESYRQLDCRVAHIHSSAAARRQSLAKLQGLLGMVLGQILEIFADCFRIPAQPLAQRGPETETGSMAPSDDRQRVSSGM